MYSISTQKNHHIIWSHFSRIQLLHKKAQLIWKIVNEIFSQLWVIMDLTYYGGYILRMTEILQDINLPTLFCSSNKIEWINTFHLPHYPQKWHCQS